MSQKDGEYLLKNLTSVEEAVRTACKQAGRNTGDVMLLAAVKTADAAEIRYLHEYRGLRLIGENRVQQLLEHYPLLNPEDFDIHFIGSLQKNKVKYIIDKVCCIQSVDSLELAEEIQRQAEKHRVNMDILVEINIGREPQKGGVLPDDLAEFVSRLLSGPYHRLRLRGFMTMAPKCTDQEYRSYFSSARELAYRIWHTLPDDCQNQPPILSMGMTDSIVPAVMEGSTMIRVGRAIFNHDENNN